MYKHELLEKIKWSVVEMEEEETKKLCKEALSSNISANDIITEGLTAGMDEVVRLFKEYEYFLPEVLICSDVFNIGLEVINPYIKKDDNKKTIKLLIGVVEGDTHDIGKNLVKILMEIKGIEVYDLGKDVSPDRFIEKAEEIKADIIGMSTLMTTTMKGMKVVIDKLKERGLREKYKIIVGGGPVSKEYAESIGADLYAEDGVEAANIVIDLMNS